MVARVIEFMLACWLAMSPFILHYPSDETFLWANDLTCACLVALFAVLSFWDPLRKIHLLTLGVAFWLCGLGYMTFPEMASPPQENSVSIGLLLLMLSIVPSHAQLPPRPWQKFYQNED